MAENYIRTSSKRSSGMSHTLFNSIPVFVKDPINNNIDLGAVLQKLEKFLPVQFTNGVDSIYIGYFDILIDREINAMYQDGAIYVTNIQDDVDDMVDDIVHEFAHAVEDVYGHMLYADNVIEEEFLGKRKRLYHIIDGISPEENVSMEYYLNPEYDIEFDRYLYKDIGYPTLSSAINGLFYSPYAITSLREYFANGFEAYFFHRDRNTLKKISPILYNKIVETIEENTDEI